MIELMGGALIIVSFLMVWESEKIIQEKNKRG
jgi:hypothetical protein